MVALNNLEDLFVDQLRDLYHAEHQLVKALPKLARAATNNDLKQAFQHHLQQTETHVNRLEKIFQQLGEKPTGRTCPAMKGLLQEGHDTIAQKAQPEVLDAALIASAQRVEHYEIAGYGTVRTYAQLLGNSDAEALLQQTLNEEADTDKKLTSLATNVINPQAQH